MGLKKDSKTDDDLSVKMLDEKELESKLGAFKNQINSDHDVA